MFRLFSYLFICIVHALFGYYYLQIINFQVNSNSKHNLVIRTRSLFGFRNTSEQFIVLALLMTAVLYIRTAVGLL